MNNKNQIGVKKINLKIVFILMIGAFLLISPFLPTPNTMPDKGLITLAILFFGIGLWFTSIIPAAITSMVVIVLFPLYGVLTFEEATSGLGKEVIYLIIAVLIMGAAVEKSGLDKRLAYNMLLLANGNTRFTIFILIAITFILTFIIPNGFGRLTVMLPIATGLITCMKDEGGENIGKAVMLAITYTPSICIATVITGSTGAIYAASLFETMLGFNWTYLHWMFVMLPGTIMILFILWLIVIWLFPPMAKTIERGKQYSHEEKEKLGPISKNELKLISLYVILIVLWVTKGFHQISIAMSAVLVVIFLFVPGINLISWKEAKKQVDWSIPLIFAAGFTLANAFEKSGVVSWMSNQATYVLNDLPVFLLTLTLMCIFALIRLGFINFAAMVASLIPVAFTFASNTIYNPVWLGMICVIASSISFLFPSQSIGNMTTFTLGYYNGQEMFKVGGLLTMTIIVITLFAAFFYWPLIGIPVYLGS